MRAARRGRGRGGARPRLVEIDLDATLLVAHSDKDGAAGNSKGGFGFHPMLAYLDGSEEALAGRLRPGNAGANTAADKIAVLDAALAQLPKRVEAREAILVRADSAGATHELIDFCRDGRLRFSVGFDLTEPIRTAILQLGAHAWVPAICQDGEPRDDGAWVAEITDGLDLSSWPADSRVIVRRERPHPGAQLSFTDHDGHRFQAVLSDQPDADIAYLEARHRGHARDPHRQRHRHGQAAVPRLRHQRGVARAVADRPRPDRLDQGTRARRQPRRLRAQAAAPPAATRRRPARLPRPPSDPARRPRLALGQRAGQRLRTTRRAPATHTLSARRDRHPLTTHAELAEQTGQLGLPASRRVSAKRHHSATRPAPAAVAAGDRPITALT